MACESGGREVACESTALLHLIFTRSARARAPPHSGRARRLGHRPLEERPPCPPPNLPAELRTKLLARAASHPPTTNRLMRGHGQPKP